MQELTIKQCERIIANHESGVQLTGVAVYRQLAEFMRENDRLREALQHYKAADDGVYQMMAGFKATKDMEDPNSIAGKALRSCKAPVTP